MTTKLSRSRNGLVNPALVQGQSMSLTWGDLASRLKGRRWSLPTRRSEKSAAAVGAAGFGEGGPPQCEGPNGEESEPTVHHDRAGHQKSIGQIELPLEDRGEAPSAKRSGEATSTAQGHERSGLDTRCLMEDLMERVRWHRRAIDRFSATVFGTPQERSSNVAWHRRLSRK